MAYGTKFILSYNQKQNTPVEIYFDYKDFVGQAMQLNSGATPALTIRSTAGDEDILYPILGSEAEINILVDTQTNISLQDFFATEDSQIRVTVYYNKNHSYPAWQGFISVEDNSAPFLDPPYILTLRAVDGLGLLKGVDLTDTNGNLLTGRYSIIEWIGNILNKTDQTLNIRTYFPFYNDALFEDLDILSQIFLDSGTFVDADTFNVNSTDPSIDVNALAGDDAYTALEKIVRCIRCKLYQWNGRWYLKSLQNSLNVGGDLWCEYSLGDPVEGIIFPDVVDVATTPEINDVNIGKKQIIFPVTADLDESLKRPTKWIQLNYTYDQPAIKICNQSLTETGNTPNPVYSQQISSSIIDTTIAPVVNLQCNGFDLYCYEHFDSDTYIINVDNASPYPSIAPVKSAYIRSVVDTLGYEIQRFMVLEKSTNPMTFVKTSKFKLDTNDVLQISFDWRTKDNIHTPGDEGTTFDVCTVYLYGDDGSFWALRSAVDGQSGYAGRGWVQTDANFQFGVLTVFMSTPQLDNAISNQWTTCQANFNSSVAYAKAPVSGDVEILFTCYQDRVATTNEYWYKNITINILPYLQGSYTQLKGDYNYSGSDANIKLFENDDVEISDGAKRYFKGVLIDTNGEVLPPGNPSQQVGKGWHRAGVTETKRFTQLMEQIMFTLLCRTFRKMEGTFRGLFFIKDNDYLNPYPIGYGNNFYFVDGDTPTKRFLMTQYEFNVDEGTFHAVFIETLSDANSIDIAEKANEGNGGDLKNVPPYLDNYTFNYLFQ